MPRSILAFLSVFCLAAICAAQPSVPDSLDNFSLYHSRLSLGIIPTWTFTSHQANFFPLLPDPFYDGCGSFTTAKGNGPGIGISADYGLGAFAVVGIQTSLLNEGGTFSYPFPLFPVYVGPNPYDTFYVARNHLFVATIYSLNIAATVKLYPIAAFNNAHASPFNRIFLNLGGSIDVPIQKSFDEREEITNTSDYKFIDGTSDHSLGVGTIPNMGSRIGAIGGIGYDIPITPTITASPQIAYNLGLTKTNSLLDWTSNILEASIAVQLTFPPASPAQPQQIQEQSAPNAPQPPTNQPSPQPVTDNSNLPSPPTPPASPKAEPPKPALKVYVTAKAPNGEPPPPIVVEEVHVRESFPMLNYIFFDSLSAVIPKRYNVLDTNSVKTFNERDIAPATLDVYHNLLNILGSRLALNPEARLTITGCIDEYSERESLSRQRAEAVRDYFANVWGIPAQRLRVAVRRSPAMASNPNYAEGRDENRRVELASDDKDDIFAQVVVVESQRESTLPDSTKKNNANAPEIDFTPTVISGAGLHNWKISIGTGENIIRTFEGGDTIPPTIAWDLTNQSNKPPNIQGTIFYSLSATDVTGQTVASPPKPLTVDQRMLTREKSEQTTEQHTIEKFSLIIFNYNSKAISPSNRKIAEEIAKRIKPNSEVTVIGYTDTLGGEEYDTNLSEERARNVVDVLEHYSHVPQSNFTVRGEGKSQIFPNDTPEGRFFCRTVQVMINTSADKDDSTAPSH